METTIKLNSYKDVQNLLNNFVQASGVTPNLAPHHTFWNNLSYDEFISQDVPGVRGFKILEVGNAAKSNIIMALSGTKGSPFDPNSGNIGQMPQPNPPYNAQSPTQNDVITALSEWINNNCPNSDVEEIEQFNKVSATKLPSGIWTYRSLINNPDLSVDFNSLEFGRANLKIEVSDNGELTGKIYDTGWELDLKGSYQTSNPSTLWFQGTGIVNGSPWAYDYLCYVVPQIPNGINQIPVLVGSVTRAIPHPDGNAGTSPAGVVCSFYAVLQTANP